MAETLPSTDGTDEHFARRKRQDDARFTLAWMKRYDRLIESYMRLPSRTDLTAKQIDDWRNRRRKEYRECTGVEIEERDALRAGLCEVVETGSRTVEQVIEDVRERYRNGSGSVCCEDEGSSPEDWLRGRFVSEPGSTR